MTAQLNDLYDAGFDGDSAGWSAREKYKTFRDEIAAYTDGKVMFTSWRWNAGAVQPNGGAGMCIADAGKTKSKYYWSCWEFKMDDKRQYQEDNSSYLINPDEFLPQSKLSDFKDLTGERFVPAMWGAWMCFTPITIYEYTFTDCMRFLPDAAASKVEDHGFVPGEKIKVMTYLTSRADGATEIVVGNEQLVSDGL